MWVWVSEYDDVIIDGWTYILSVVNTKWNVALFMPLVVLYDDRGPYGRDEDFVNGTIYFNSCVR